MYFLGDFLRNSDSVLGSILECWDLTILSFIVISYWCVLILSVRSIRAENARVRFTCVVSP